MPNSVEFELPIRTKSEANQREHWSKRSRRFKEQARLVDLFARQWLDDVPPMPWRITLTRIGPRYLDPDNAAGSTKQVQDSLAALLGIDDGDRAHRWIYDQKKRTAKDGGYGVGVRIETRKDSE